MMKTMAVVGWNPNNLGSEQKKKNMMYIPVPVEENPPNGVKDYVH